MGDVSLTLVSNNNVNPIGHVIFLHGLGGSGVSTWTHEGVVESKDIKSNASVYFPKLISSNFPNINVWSLDYSAKITKWADPANFNELPRVANEVLEYLLGILTDDKPIVLIAHSLGGIVAKELLKKSKDSKNKRRERFFNRTKAVSFLATPHAGSRWANILNNINSVLPFIRTGNAIDELEFDNSYLQELSDWYRNNIDHNKIETQAFFETKSTNGIKVVERISADPAIRGCNPIRVDENHINICKPSSIKSSVYISVKGLIEYHLLGNRANRQEVCRTDIGSCVYAHENLWRPEYRSIRKDTLSWDFKRILPFARYLFDDVSTLSDNSIVERDLELIGDNAQPKVMIVCGPHGAGKSLWMMLLYEASRRRKEKGYIDLTPRFMDIENDLERLAKCGKFYDFQDEMHRTFKQLESSDNNIFFIDSCVRDNPLLPQLLYYLSGHISTSRIVFAVDEAFESELINNLNDNEIPMPVVVRRLHSIGSDDKQAEQFCNSFIVAYRELGAIDKEMKEARDGRALLDRMNKLDFKTLDTHLLTIVFNTLNDVQFTRCHDKADFFDTYCYAQLMKAASTSKMKQQSILDEDILYASQLAFDQFNGRYEPASYGTGKNKSHRAHRAQILVQEHQDLRDFLTARHLTELLRHGATNESIRKQLCDDDLLISDIPENVSMYVKQMINRDDDVKAEVMRTIRETHLNASPQVSQYMYYLLGRIENASLNSRAREILNNRKKNIQNDINKAKTEEELIEKLAVLRTIFVSLIYLVDQEAEAEYIQHLNTNYRSASVNRGFYRIYYGDLVSGIEKGALRYLDDDPDQSWSHTRESLIRSLNAYVASENEGKDISLGLSVFTLISFLYSRINKSHNASDFEEDYSVLKRCLTKIESNYLRNLVRGFLKDYEDGVFSVWDFVFSLYKLKTLQRQGWLDRGLSKNDLKSAESVADHGYLCCILAWLLLPEPGPSESYSKKTIIEMLMVHDIAEAYIGDQVTNSMSNEELQKYKLEENEAMSYLRTRDTYEEVSGAELAYLRWQEFDKDTESVNASLAKDFDRLENLVQLELYRSNLNQDEYHKFRKSLVDQLKMPQVQRLASSLVGWIDPIIA